MPGLSIGTEGRLSEPREKKVRQDTLRRLCCYYRDGSGLGRLGAAQATLAETKAAKMRGELVEVDAVEKLWITKIKAFRARVLAIPTRVKDLSARQSASLTQELRAALTEFADDKDAGMSR